MKKRRGAEFESFYVKLLRELGRQKTCCLPEPEVLVAEIIEEIEAALESFREVASELNGEHLLFQEGGLK